MAAQPYVLARTMREAHEFARGELGLAHGQYRIVNSPSTIKSVRGADLYLVPGYANRFDRFAIKGAIRWTRMNVIDVEKQQAEAPAIPDDLDPAGEQLLIPVGDDEASAFVLSTNEDTAEVSTNGDNMISEGSPVAPEPETTEPPKKRRRSRCKDCGNLHFKGEPCPDETTLEGA